MKFRDIAKMHAYNRGLKDQITEADMRHYLDHLGDSDSVTPGRLDRANEALASLGESLSKKWDLPKKFLRADHPGASEEQGNDED